MKVDLQPIKENERSHADELILLPCESDSVALARLIEEVRGGDQISFEAYNRTYHRHNR